MHVEVSQTSLDEILPLRELYRREMSCQIVHDSWHRRGFTASYLIRVDGRVAGYGSVGGVGDEPKDTVKEFYVLPVHRPAARKLFDALVAAARAGHIEAQSNDVLLTLMLFDRVEAVERDRVLFRDGLTTAHTIPGARFRRITESDHGGLFEHEVEGVGDWGIEVDGDVVATGGVMHHYNPPYGDIYMEVGRPWRRRGYGTLLVQELKRVCYESGRVPAARCNASNVASRATLERAGMVACARILRGSIGRPRA